MNVFYEIIKLRDLLFHWKIDKSQKWNAAMQPMDKGGGVRRRASFGGKWGRSCRGEEGHQARGQRGFFQGLRGSLILVFIVIIVPLPLLSFGW